MKPVALSLLIVASLASLTSLAAPQDCNALLNTAWPDVHLQSSTAVDQPVPHCKVSGVIDDEINFELLLPAQWNGKFVMGGGGGFVGTIDNQAMTMSHQPLEQGYATVGTDTGHQGSGIEASWALDNLQRQVNFGFWAVHRTAEVSKALVKQHYGKPSQRDYFVGCSNGGRQAMMEAQRFPDDFDGIVAAAPAMNFIDIGAHFAQIQKVMYPNPQNLDTPVVSPQTLQLVQDRVLAACDAQDGITDGALNDPRDCAFDLASIPACSTAEAADQTDQTQATCLTPERRAALQVIYEGARNSQGIMFPGFPLGNEAVPGSWNFWLTGGAGFKALPGMENSQVPSLSYAFGIDMMKYLVFNDTAWDYTRYDWDRFAQDSRRARATINAVNTDLSAFKAQGGKLILWHGWSDPALTAYDSVHYFEAVEKADANVRDYLRLFLAPGVLHCAGGPGASLWDPLAEIDRWVDKQQAPQRIEAFFVEDGEAAGSRPMCSYPQKAVYRGTGDTRDSASFDCK